MGMTSPLLQFSHLRRIVVIVPVVVIVRIIVIIRSIVIVVSLIWVWVDHTLEKAEHASQ